MSGPGHDAVIRSLLYVPASSERFIAKAHERGADAIILDLEDAVVAAEKSAARARLASAVINVGQRGATVFVRINSQPELTRLDAARRVEELARMLGGHEITAKTRAHARELLAQNQRRESRPR